MKDSIACFSNIVFQYPAFAYVGAAGNTFQAVDQGGNRYFRRIFNQQMNMVIFTIHFSKRSIKIGTNACKDHS